MVINDPKEFKFIAQLFLLFALGVHFTVCGILKYKKVEITYNLAFKLLIFMICPIILFPFMVFSTVSIFVKILEVIVCFSCCFFGFFGWKYFHRIKKNYLTKRP